MDDVTKTNPDDQIEDAVIIDPELNPEVSDDGNIQSSETSISPAESSSSDTPNSDVSTLLEIEKAIKMRIAALDRYKEEIKPIKEMLESTLEADLGYAEVSEVAKEAAKKKTAKKKELLNTPAGKDIIQKLNLLKDTIREHQESLSYFLQEYSRLTGAKEIEGEDGELRQIVYNAKLVRKTNLQRE